MAERSRGENYPYRIPRLMDLNVGSKLLRGKEKLLVVGRCIEIEKPWALERFSEKDYAVVSVCLEETHVNQAGFKLAGVLARLPFREVAVLTTDGSMHCIQLHYMVEEIAKISGNKIVRRHYVATRDSVEEIPVEVVKISRYLSRVKEVYEQCLKGRSRSRSKV